MNPLALPETILQNHLRDRPGSGTFEAHITVEAADADARKRFRDLCGELGVKCVVIELTAGTQRSQPMTASYHRGALADAVAEIVELARRVRAGGFPIARLKLEAVASNVGVPATDAEAADFPPENYFEFHVKLLLPPGADLTAAHTVCDRHNARLSTNALKQLPDGWAERFVTLRAYGAGRDVASAAFDRLLVDLEATGYALGPRQREYTLFDSTAVLDAGWLDAPTVAGRP